MKPKRKAKNNNKLIIRIIGLLVIFLFLSTVPSHSQKLSEKQKQIPQPSVTVEYSDVDIIQNPVVGVIILPKDRWKNWTARCVYLLLINSLIFVVILSLPKTEKYNLIASYFLSGSSFMISLWLLMLSYLLFRLKTKPGSLMFLAGLISLVVAYIVLIKIKKCDVIDETQKVVTTTDTEDKRFATIQGHTSELPEDDFIK